MRATETERDTAQAGLRRASAALVDEIGRADEAEYRIAELEELLAAERAARKTAESKLSARTKALEFTQSRLRRKSQQFINEKQAHKDTQALLRRVSAALVDEIGRADNTQTNLQSMQQTAQHFAGLWIKTRRELQASQDKLRRETARADNTQTNLQSMQQTAQHFAGLWIKTRRELQAAFWDEATVKKAISLALYEDAGDKVPIACLQNSTKVKSLDQAKDGRMKVSFDAGKAVPCGRRQGTKPYTVEQRKRLTEGWITDHPHWLEHRYSEG